MEIDKDEDRTFIDHRYESRIRIGDEINRGVRAEIELFELLHRTEEFQRLKEIMEERIQLYEKEVETLKNRKAIEEARENEVVETEKLGIKNEDLHKSLNELEEIRNKRLMV